MFPKLRCTVYICCRGWMKLFSHTRTKMHLGIGMFLESVTIMWNSQSHAQLCWMSTVSTQYAACYWLLPLHRMIKCTAIWCTSCETTPTKSLWRILLSVPNVESTISGEYSMGMTANIKETFHWFSLCSTCLIGYFLRPKKAATLEEIGSAFLSNATHIWNKSRNVAAFLGVRM